jgi:hypothetical protein
MKLSFMNLCHSWKTCRTQKIRESLPFMGLCKVRWDLWCWGSKYLGWCSGIRICNSLFIWGWDWNLLILWCSKSWNSDRDFSCETFGISEKIGCSFHKVDKWLSLLNIAKKKIHHCDYFLVQMGIHHSKDCKGLLEKREQLQFLWQKILPHFCPPTLQLSCCNAGPLYYHIMRHCYFSEPMLFSRLHHYPSHEIVASSLCRRMNIDV